MAKKGGLMDLETQFSIYKAYHSNPVNVLIHTLFVWPMFFTTLMLFHFTPPIFDVSGTWFADRGLVVNFGFFFTLTYAVLYLYWDKKAGGLATLLCFGCWVVASFISNKLGYSVSWKVVLAAQLISLMTQIIGHKAFEGRSPPAVDNLAQALLTVPFFVLLEVLRFGFGYEPYPGFYENVGVKIEAEMKEWKEEKQKKTT